MTGDRINPIVVKELRQGLKSRSFLLFFVGLQIAMVLSMFVYITSVIGQNARLEGADAFFWTIIGVLLLLLLPLRAFQALHDEIRENTLELLFLSRLTAWKITWGKWVAHALQALLMVSAVFPYFVLRYFLGAIDIPSNLLVLALTLGTSLVLIGMGVGLSSTQSRLIRILILLGGIMGAWSLITGVMAFSSMRGMGASSPFHTPTPDWIEALALLLSAVAVLFFFLEHGASKIAPPAENHAGRKRALGMFLVLLSCGYALMEDAVEIVAFTTVVLGPFLCIGALNETLPRVSSAFRGWRPASLFNWLFLPGWPSGFLYALFIYALLSGTALTVDGDPELKRFFLSLFNVVLAPYVLIGAIPRLHPHRLPAYLSLQVSGVVIAVMLMVLRDMRMIADGTIGLLGAFLPVLGFFQFETRSLWQPYRHVHLAVALLLLLLSIALTLPAWKQIHRLRHSLRHETND